MFSTNLEYYKVFYYAVKCGSLSAAANMLGLTQPTVTSTIQHLEEQLRCTLFVRSKKGVSLTREGQLLWNRIEPACQLMISAEQDIKTAQQFKGGTLSIAATEMGFSAYVLPVLDKFVLDFPNIKIKFLNFLTIPILDKLRSGEIDLAILHEPFEFDKELNVRPFSTITECFVAGPKYAHLAGKENTLEELSKYPQISVLHGSATKQFAKDIFRESGQNFDPDIEVTTIELVIQSVMHNLGIATLPFERAKPYIDAGKLFLIPTAQSEIELKRKAYVLTHKDIPLRPSAEIFLNKYLLPAFDKGENL